jgi:hypothetical protein
MRFGKQIHLEKKSYLKKPEKLASFFKEASFLLLIYTAWYKPPSLLQIGFSNHCSQHIQLFIVRLKT